MLKRRHKWSTRLDVASPEWRNLLSDSPISANAIVGTAKQEHPSRDELDVHSFARLTEPATPAAAAHLSALLADAKDAVISGKAQCESETENGHTESTFLLAIQGAAPSQTYEVTVDRVLIGLLKTDALGAGKLKLSNRPDSATPLPADFPLLAAGLVVTVGTSLTGTLAAPTFGRDDRNLP